MEALISSQYDRYESIKKAGIKFKEAVKEKMTEDYVECKIKHVERDFQKFCETDDRIKVSPERVKFKENPYFVDDLKEKVEEEYDSVIVHMRETKKQLHNQHELDEHVRVIRSLCR